MGVSKGGGAGSGQPTTLALGDAHCHLAAPQATTAGGAALGR